MQKKTLARMEKREEHELSEIHILDTEIVLGAILELAERTHGPYLKYFGKLKSSDRYRAYVPLAAYGESFEKIPRVIAQKNLASAITEFIEITKDILNPHYPSDIGIYIECLEKTKEIGNRCGAADAIILAEGIMLKEKLREEGSEKNVYLVTDDRKISCKDLPVKNLEIIA